MAYRRPVRLLPPCCRECGKFNRQICEARDGKCREFEAWFVTAGVWKRVVEGVRRMQAYHERY